MTDNLAVAVKGIKLPPMPLRRYAVKIINPETGQIGWLYDWLGGCPLCRIEVTKTFSFEAAWQIRQKLKQHYPLVQVVAVRE